MKEEKYYCRDCRKEMLIEGGELTNGKMLGYNTNNNKKDLTFIFKCNECYAKNPALTDYQSCEVYDRIVGYIRPVQQWNPSKQSEYRDRKKFKINGKKF